MQLCSPGRLTFLSADPRQTPCIVGTNGLIKSPIKVPVPKLESLSLSQFFFIDYQVPYVHGTAGTMIRWKLHTYPWDFLGHSVAGNKNLTSALYSTHILYIM